MTSALTTTAMIAWTFLLPSSRPQSVIEPSRYITPMPEHGPMPLIQRLATPIQTVMTLGLYLELAVLGGVSATPGAYAGWWLFEQTARWSPFLRTMAACCLVFAAYFSYAVFVIFVVGIFRRITFAGTPLGRYSYYSFKGYQWASYNALILLVRYTCIDFMRVTPFINLFHRLMGMKLGARVQINTAIIGDSNLIEIGDDTVIGGDVTLVAHAAEHGDLVTARVKIGSRVTVGLMAVVFPGVEIGDGAMIAANAILLKGTKVGPREIWGGVPAKKLGERGQKRAPPAAGAD
jgi:acetyltransferase-like isoleucine patch superfamily enzyme